MAVRKKSGIERWRYWIGWWQQMLGLTDWDVTVVDSADENADKWAEVEFDVVRRCATVNVYAPRAAGVRRLAAHEMLHLLLADLLAKKVRKDRAVEEERVVCSLACALDKLVQGRVK